MFLTKEQLTAISNKAYKIGMGLPVKDNNGNEFHYGITTEVEDAILDMIQDLAEHIAETVNDTGT